MQGLGDKFLAGAAFSIDIDIRVCFCRPGHLFHDRLHLLALADDVLESVFFPYQRLKPSYLPGKRAFFKTIFYLKEEIAMIEWLCEIAVSPLLHGLYRGLDGSVGGKDDNRHFGEHGVKVPHQYDAAFSFDLEINKRKVKRVVFGHLQSSLWFGCHGNLVTLPLNPES